MESTKSKVMLYTEQTPNPETLKFVLNKILYRGTADFSDVEFANKWSPLATALYEFPYVKSVFISNNYVTVTKEMNYSWADIMLKVKDFIKNYVEEGKEIVNEGFEEVAAEMQATGNAIDHKEEDSEIVQKINDLIDTYVKPAVEMDGGNIAFKKYEEGKVYVELQGSCSGCPSSTVTLKSGIEGMLKRMLPQVDEVIALMG